MNFRNTTARRSAGGFTLVEMSMSMAILTLLTVGIFNVFYQVLQAYNETSLMSTTAVQASFALDRMVIGVGTNAGLGKPRPAPSPQAPRAAIGCFRMTTGSRSHTPQTSMPSSTNPQLCRLESGCLDADEHDERRPDFRLRRPELGGRDINQYDGDIRGIQKLTGNTSSNEIIHKEVRV